MAARLDALQILRGVAALAVIVSHTIGRAIRDGFDVPDILLAKPELIVFGHLGVDVFFVISGFIMYYIHRHDFGKTALVKKFIVSRVIRIVPIYWLLSFLALFLLLLFPELFSFREGVEVSWVLGSLFFIPVTTSYGLSSPLLGVGWTLNYEFYFYFIFSICLLLSKRNGLLLMAFVIAFVLFEGDKNITHTKNVWDLVTSFMVVEFFMGVCAAYFFVRFKEFLIKFGWVFLGLSLVLYGASLFSIPETYFQRLLFWGTGAFFLVLFSVSLPLSDEGGGCRAFFVRMGDYSYSAYLIQVFSIPALSIVLRAVSGSFFSLNYIVYVPVVVGLTLLVSYLFWFFVEKPLTLYLKRLPSINRRLSLA